MILDPKWIEITAIAHLASPRSSLCNLDETSDSRVFCYKTDSNWFILKTIKIIEGTLLCMCSAAS